jgi:hypothetical protein
MKKLLFAAAVVSAFSVNASAAAEEIQATAEVVKVDKLTQTVTVRGAGGETTKIRVSPEVQNLDQIQPGSVLNVRYVQAAAVAIGKMGFAVPAAEDEIMLDPANAAPGEEVMLERFIIARVEGVDPGKRELKVKGPDDETITLHVAPGVSGFEDAKIGNTVAIRFTGALALVVTPK